MVPHYNVCNPTSIYPVIVIADTAITSPGAVIHHTKPESLEADSVGMLDATNV